MLAGLLSRPELVQSLFSSLLGRAGRSNVAIGGQQVPVSQMLSALSNVAGRAAHEAAEAEGAGEDTPEYAEYAAEAFGIDPEDAEGRADALLLALALAQPVWHRPAPPVNVQINPADPYFPAGETYWNESDENWGGEDWDSEDWDGEDWDSAETDETDESDESAEAWEYEGV